MPHGQGTVQEMRPKQVITITRGSGLIVTGQIDGLPVKFLVDTGASITLVSQKVVNFEDHQIDPVSFDIYQANGDPLPVVGQIVSEITLGPLRVSHNIVVADIHDDAILGIDFLMQHDCKLDLPSQQLSIQGTTVNMWKEDEDPGCCRVSVKENTTIPAKHEKIILGQVHRRGNESHTNVLEGTAKFTERYGLMIARALVDIQHGQVLMRVLNPTECDTDLRGGTTAAMCYPAVAFDDTEDRTYIRTVQINELEVESRSDEISPQIPDHLKDMIDRSSEHLDDTQIAVMTDLMTEYQDIFAKDSGDLGRTDKVKHRINTGDAPPIKQRPRRIPLHLREEARKQTQDMLERDIIEPSESPWSSPVVLVKKKDNTWRYCIDYRKVNFLTRKDAKAIPDYHTDLPFLSGAKFFLTVDFQSGYWQIEVDPQDREKTAFTTPDGGLYQFKVLPFGLCNAPATFERFIEHVFSGLQYTMLLIYLDDVIIFGSCFEEKIERLAAVFNRIRNAKLKLKPSKCVFFQKEVSYLGHLVSEKGVATDPEKVEAVKNWPRPTNITEVRSLVGLCSYYRRFIKNFAIIAAPLHELTKKNKQFIWTEKCETAFQQLIKSLSEAPILAYPRPECQFTLDTDASDTGIGAVLSQIIDGEEHVIAYASRSLSKPERRYCVTRRELLAVVHFVKYFRHFLYGSHFVIRTDHGSLRWLYNFKEPEGQIARWMETLAMYDFEIRHRPGKMHGNADALSRRPCRQCGMDDTQIMQQVTVLTRSQDTQDTEQEYKSDENPEIQWISSIGNEALSQEQMQDKVIGQILKWKTENRRPNWGEISGQSAAIKAYWSMWNQLEIKNDVLYKRWDEDVSGKCTWQLVVPECRRQEVLQMVHDHITAGHLGEHKTLANLRLRFYWYGHRKDVEKWCGSCDLCASRKGPSKKR